MDQNLPHQHIPAPLGIVEPHTLLLNVPHAGQLLYKVMTVENLLRSISDEYLYFNRVDSYKDFPGADIHDGQQLARDQPGNAGVKFAKAPDFSVANYFDQSRARTYACCFSLENSDFIWGHYANGGVQGKVCVVFDFAKLRARLNQTLRPGNAALEYNGNRCHQIFSVNYGVIEYIEWSKHQANTEELVNPIQYTYWKDKQFAEEKELRISLSVPGMGQFSLADGSVMEFPASLQTQFDFRMALADGTIQQILFAPDCDSDLLLAELRKLQIVPGEGIDPSLRSSAS